MRRALVCIIVLLTVTGTTRAQSELNFKRIVNNWPTIELYFQITCNGEKKNDVNTEDFAITENGNEIGTYTVWCPDPNIHCAVSLSLAIEVASEAHRGVYRNMVRGILFGSESLTDEYAMTWYDQYALMDAGMTVYRAEILSAYDRIPIASKSGFLDLTIAALHKLMNEGNNPCRAVIVFMDGEDTTSVHTAQDIISLANRNRIRVFGIALSGGGDTPSLETITLLTGGKFYLNPSVAQLWAIYNEISTIIFGGFLECLVTYQATCMDGTLRTTELHLRNYCGGDDSKTKTYRAPKDTSTNLPFMLGIEPSDVAKADRFSVPFSLLTPMTKSNYNNGFSAELVLPQEQIQFIGLSIPKGSLLNEPGDLRYEFTNEGIRLSYEGTVESNRTGTLCLLHFLRVSPWPEDSLSIRTESVDFIGGCSRFVPYDGVIRFIDDPTLEISLLDQAVQCWPGTVRLRASAGFSDYRWSTGEDTREILTARTGDYWVTAKTANGIQVVSDTLMVVIYPDTTPSIEISHNSDSCGYETATLSIEGQYVDYKWSTGSTESEIVVDNSGQYSVTVTDSNGCVYSTKSSHIALTNYDRPGISGTEVSCSGTYGQYKCNNDYRLTYTWEAIGGTITDYLKPTNLLVWWENDTTGLVIVTARIGSCMYVDTMIVDLSAAEKPVIDVDGPRFVCSGVETILRVHREYDHIRWSTGNWGAELVVDKAGIYTVSAGNTSNCFLTSDTVVIGSLPSPVVPVITRRGDSLFSSEGFTYTWSRDGTVLQGRNGKSIQALETGTYRVIVSNEYGCIAESENYEVAVLGIEEQAQAVSVSVDVFPTQTDDVFHLNVRSWTARHINVSIIDIYGRVLQSRQLEAHPDSKIASFSLYDYPIGMYFVRVNYNEGQVVKMVLRARH